MKTTTLRIITLSLFAILCACSKKPVKITGQIFVVTQGRENIEMGALEVQIIPDAEFQTIARSIVPWMQKEARHQLKEVGNQLLIDGDHMSKFARELRAMEAAAPTRLAELYFQTIREALVAEFESTQERMPLAQSALSSKLFESGIGRLMSGVRSRASVTTDANGRFTTSILGKTWFLAKANRKVGDETEEYIWVKGFELPEGMLNPSLIISNESILHSDDELYTVLTSAIGMDGNLDEFRNVSSDVSEEMASLIANRRLEALEVKSKAEWEAGEIEAYEKFRGHHAGEQKIIEIAPGVNMTFCWCPAGEFMMGSPTSETGRGDDEDPVNVTLSKGFWMSKTEVTQEQWQAVMGTNPSKFKGANLPVENVNWNDTQGFLAKLNKLVGSDDGGRMMLPTEAQWEYAARAGERHIYSGGSLSQVAWWSDNSARKTHAAGTKKANAWGLHDMSGNVFEWCADWYADDLKGGIDPAGPDLGTYRLNRGGCWLYKAYFCRVAHRYSSSPSFSLAYVGFRVARISVP